MCIALNGLSGDDQALSGQEPNQGMFCCVNSFLDVAAVYGPNSPYSVRFECSILAKSLSFLLSLSAVGAI